MALVIMLIAGTGLSSFSDVTYEDLRDEHAAQISRRQNTVRILAVGDIMMHMPIVNSVSRAGKFEFESIFSEMRDYFSAADLVSRQS